MNGQESGADAYERARRRVQELRGLYTHAVLFAVLSVIQFVIDWASDAAGERGIDWAYWSFFGWGAGVAMHAWSVLGRSFGQEWERRKIKELVAKERKREESLQGKMPAGEGPPEES